MCAHLGLVAVITTTSLPLLDVVAVHLLPVLVHAAPAPAAATPGVILALPVGGAHALVLVATARHLCAWPAATLLWAARNSCARGDDAQQH